MTSKTFARAIRPTLPCVSPKTNIPGKSIWKTIGSSSLEEANAYRAVEDYPSECQKKHVTDTVQPLATAL